MCNFVGYVRSFVFCCVCRCIGLQGWLVKLIRLYQRRNVRGGDILLPSEGRLVAAFLFSNHKPESPTRGLRSSLPACTASLIVGSSKACDLDPDLESGPGHINIHSTCRTTNVPNDVTVVSAVLKYGHLNFVKYRHSAKFAMS